MVLKLYKGDLSPPARAAMMTAEAVKAPVEFININLSTLEHLSPEYIKKNPLHTVPFLEDDNLAIPDSHAIMIYLAELMKNTDLYPTDPKKRALVNARLFFSAGSLFPSLRNVTYYVFTAGLKGPSQQNIDDINKCYDFTETFLSKSKYIAGDSLTLADISCVADISGLNFILPLDESKYPKTTAWWKGIRRHDFYKKFELGEKQLGEAYRAVLKKNNA